MELDSWRGICACMVALFHLEVYGHFYTLGLIRNSFLFVDFFFVLSGFVISHAYAETLRRPIDAARFVVRRFGRLWPLHAALLAILVAGNLLLSVLGSAGVDLPSPPFSPKIYPLDQLPVHFLLLQGLGFSPEGMWDAPSWSISAEFFTYLVFAGCALVAGRWAATLLPAIACSVIVLGVWVLAYWSPSHMEAAYDYGFVRSLYGFFLGHLVWRAYRSGVAVPWPGFAEPLMVLFTAAMISIAWHSQWSVFIPFLFAGTILVFAQGRGPLSVVLRSAPFQTLGRLSYSIYMVHWLVLIAYGHAGIALLSRVFHRNLEISVPSPESGLPVLVVQIGGRFGSDLWALAFLLTVVGLAEITYRLIEIPGRTYCNDWVRRRLAGRHAAGRKMLVTATRFNTAATSDTNIR